MKANLRISSRPWVRLSAASLVATLLIPSLAFAQSPALPPPSATDQSPAPSQNIPVATTPSNQGGSSEAPIELSPFEVNASQQQGYLSTNTLAGTRLNTNIGDLPGSVTVVTKEQMEDTNSLNINDVFRFEANTEGAGTYTPYTSGASTERGNAADALGGAGGNILSGQVTQYADALDSGNRVRGLSTVDNEEDNFYSLYRIPFDAYNTESVEIDRGPNSIIYGTGSPAGIVNQSRADAVFDKFSGEADLEGGSWGTFRESVNFNIPLIPDTLAIYVAQMYNSQGFEQKPSSDITRRQYIALKFNPFKSHKTTLKASFENYNEYTSDPNALTPQDFVTPWLASGRPIWNVLNDTVSYLNTGQTNPYTYVNSTTNPLWISADGSHVGSTYLSSTTSPLYVPNMGFFSGGHIISFVNQGQYLYTFKGTQTGLNIPNFIPATTSMTAAQYIINSSYGMAESQVAPITPHYATWQIPTVDSKNVYDWSTINIDSLNHATTSAKTYHVDLQQSIIDSETWGSLNFDFGWFRQELQQTSDDPLSQESGTTMAVDENEYLPNGQVNPHEGQPYLETYQSGVVVAPEVNNNFRGMLEYEINLQDKVPSWLSFVGHHRFLTVYSQHDDVQTELVYRPSIIGGDPNYMPTATSYASTSGISLNANGALEAEYYLGDNGFLPNGQATLSPGFMSRAGFGGPSALPIQTYNYATGTWQTTTVDLAGLLTPGGGLQENLQDSKTYFWQSYFWNDRIVGSLGLDDDQVKSRQTVFPTTNPSLTEYNSIGLPNPAVWYREGPWSYIGGNTSTEGLVVHPLKNWAGIDSAANSGNLLAAFARTLGFTFNKSNNFNPPAQQYTDFFGNIVGKPTGDEKDYGMEIATPDNKLFLRATWFTTDDLNQVGDAPTSTARATYIDQNEIKDWATDVVEIRNGENPTTDPNFGNTNVYPITTAEQSQISALTGLPYFFGGNVGGNGEYVNPTDTENSQARGTEVEVEYNPLPNWTMKLSWGKQQTAINSAAAQAEAWVNYRLPFWQAATAPDMATTYTTTGGNVLSLKNFWNGYGFGNAGQTGSNPGVVGYYQTTIATQLAVDSAANGTLATNQREYSWSYLTNYTFDRGVIKGLGIGTALQFTGRALSAYYGSTTELNSAGQVAAPNTSLPIYTPAYLHVNLWASYQFQLPWSHLRAKVQFNVADLTSSGYLLPVSFNYDGSPAAFRIIQPRQYTLETTVKF
jgi:outer membrane receptor protein involved in Fe transport